MSGLCIGIVLFCRVIMAVLNKKSSNKIQSIHYLIGYTAYQNTISAIAGLVLIIAGGLEIKLDTPTILISLLAGITLFLSILLGIYAMKSSSIGLSSMFATGGLILPLLAGIILFNQPIRSMQLFGLVVFFIAAYLLIGSSKEMFGEFTIKTLVILIAILMANGGTMLAQQLFTQYVPNGNISVFSFLSFALVSVLGLFVYIISKPADNCDHNEQRMSGKDFALNGFFLALALFIINQLSTFLAASVPPIILFTFTSGGGTILSTIVAAILYKEKLSVKNVAGIVLGVLSLVIMKMY